MQALRLSRWEESILVRIQWRRQLIWRRNILVMSTSFHDDRKEAETLDVVRFEDVRYCIRCHSYVLVQIVETYYVIWNPVHQTPSTVSLIDQSVYLLLWLSHTFNSIPTFYRIRLQIERSCPSMKFEK